MVIWSFKYAKTVSEFLFGNMLLLEMPSYFVEEGTVSPGKQCFVIFGCFDKPIVKRAMPKKEIANYTGTPRVMTLLARVTS